MTYNEIKPIIEFLIMKSEDRRQDTIDDIIWDTIGHLENKQELFETICENGAFGWLEETED
jgi:hypothetical protein